MELLYFKGIEVAYNKLVSKHNNSMIAYKALHARYKEMKENTMRLEKGNRKNRSRNKS